MAAVTAAGRRQEPSAGRPASAPGARVQAARVPARPCTPRAQDTHRAGFRGVVPPGQQRGVLRLATAPSGVAGRDGR
jgi:hypothetical protein